MHTQEGWIKLHRRITENNLWLSEKFTKAQAWIDLILMANHKDAEVTVDYKKVKIKRGQLMTSQSKLAKRWKWNRRTVNRFLSWLEAGTNVALEVHNAFEHGFTIVTIQKYEHYQESTQGNAQGSNMAMHTNKNVKNDKNNNYIFTDAKASRGEKDEKKKKKSNPCPLGTENHKQCLDFLDQLAAQKNMKTWINYAKQIGFLHKLLKAGITMDEIKVKAKELDSDKFMWDKWDLGTIVDRMDKAGKEVIVKK